MFEPIEVVGGVELIPNTPSGITIYKDGNVCSVFINNLTYDGTNSIQLPQAAYPIRFFATPIFGIFGSETIARASISASSGTEGELYFTNANGAKISGRGIVGALTYITSD